MKKNSMYPVIISIILTAVVVWGLMTLLSPPPDVDARVEELEAEVQSLTSEKEGLSEQITVIESEKGVLQDKLDALESREINRQPNPGWEDYFPTHDTNTLIGKSVADVEALLGIPPVMIRSIAASEQFNREIWVYIPYEEDPTGLYLFFKDNKLWRSQLNEFTGVYGSGLLEGEDFWLN